MKENTITSDKKLNIIVFLGLLMAAALVGIDQLTKWIVVSNMELHESVHLIKFGETQVLNLSYYLNDGSAFSMFGGQTEMLICVTSLMMGAMLCAMVMKQVRRTPYIIAFSLIIGGGVGNLIDRLFNEGLVVDFIDVRIINFAIFNFADICAVCGGILLCLLVVVDEIKDVREKKAKKSAEEYADDNSEETKNNEEATEDGND